MTQAAYSVAFGSENFSLKAQEDTSDKVNALLAQKASLFLRHDDLQHSLLECGISPVAVNLSYGDTKEEDMLSLWRVKLALLKMINCLSKIAHGEEQSKILTLFEKTVTDIVLFLAQDYVQIGKEFKEKLGNSAYFDELSRHIQDHKTAIASFENHLKRFKHILHSIK